MQITINIPDNLPTHIVQQYINTIEAQMRLLSELAKLLKAMKYFILKITAHQIDCLKLAPVSNRKAIPGFWIPAI